MFTVEDGSVVGGANSYVSLEYAIAYFADRNRSAEFEGTDTERQGWLVNATSYIDMRWSTRFGGGIYSPSQALAFPRLLPYSGNAWMPDNLLRATCEYAARAKRGPLAPDPVVDSSGHSVVMTGRKVGPIERTFAVVPGSRATLFRVYPAADALIAPLLLSQRRQVIR